MGHHSTWSVSVSLLLLGMVSTDQFKSNLMSSEYLVHKSTWVIREHGLSEYMGRQSTWVVRVHGSPEYMVSISKCPTLRPGQYRPVQVKSNLIRVHGSAEYMGHQST